MLVGIDSCEKERFEHLMNNGSFLHRVFTDYEIQYANKTTNKTLRLAGLYCAKEAFLKALQMGIGGGITLQQVGIKHLQSGAPVYEFDDNVQAILQNLGVTNTVLSITHTAQTSTAICICETK